MGVTRLLFAICYLLVLTLLSSSLYAQCSSVSASLVIPANSAAVEVDVNLDGIMDFSFGPVSVGGLQAITITGLNGHQILTATTASGLVGTENVLFGELICANANYAASTTLYSASQALGLIFAASGGAYIGITNGTNIGFMNIQISNIMPNSITISYSEYGVGIGMHQTACAGIAAVAGDCYSLSAVELRSFEGYLTDYGIQVKWITEREYQNAGFYLERSLDGKEFKNIQWIDGQGTRPLAKEYMFEDLKPPLAERYYYRLLQLNENGGTHYSETILINAKSARTIVSNIYPNPANLDVWVELDVAYNTKATFSLYNTTGKCLERCIKDLQTGKNSIALRIPPKVKDVLFLEIQLNNRRFYRPVLLVK